MSAAWSYECAVRTEILGIKLQLPPIDPYFRKIAENLPKLRGKNLACWCPKDMPDCYCHAGKLLEMANGKLCEHGGPQAADSTGGVNPP